jgi:cell division protein FtsL
MSEPGSRKDDLALRDSTILNKYTRQLARYTLVLAIATVVTMVGTIWIAYSTKELRDFAEQQAKDSQKQVAATNAALKAAETQALEATTANNLANKAISNSIDIARKQIRAYLVFSNPVFKDILQNSMTMSLDVTNVGATPAYNVGFFVGFQFVDFPFKENNVPDIIDFQELSRVEGSPTVLGSKDPITIQAVAMKGVTDKDIQDFRNRKKALLFQAEVSYRDIYEGPHETTICEFKIFDRGLGAANICPKFNQSN